MTLTETTTPAVPGVGSHAGVSIGSDGPSQTVLEDLAMMRALHGSAVVYPCDANQSAERGPLLVEQPGVGYLRTTRGATPGVYRSDAQFELGGSVVVRSSEHDSVVIVAAGVTEHEALAAAAICAAVDEPIPTAY